MIFFSRMMLYFLGILFLAIAYGQVSVNHSLIKAFLSVVMAAFLFAATHAKIERY